MNNLFDLKDFVKYSDTFIETGTCAGDGVDRAVKAGFKYIESVELERRFYEQSKNRFALQSFNWSQIDDKAWFNLGSEENRIAQVVLNFGDSRDILQKILYAIPRNVVIFLDAHPAGPGTAGHDDLMEKGSLVSEFAQHKIILSELEIIRDHAKSPHIILIDDVNGEGDLYKEWIVSESESPSDYKFQYLDQQLGDKLYKQKILCCIPTYLK